MKIVPIFVVVITLLITGLARSESLDEANRAFVAGQFHASTLGYESILAEKGYSAPVLFDLGNSYYREGKFAQAILAYQRARWLSPSNPDVAANLQLVQNQAGIAVAQPRWSEQLTQFLSPSAWAWVGCGAWVLLCASLLARASLTRPRALLSFSILASTLVLFAAITAAMLSSHSLYQAVVTDKNASALISPFSGAQMVFSPTAGETVTVQKSYDDFFLVTDRAGHSGWIGKNQITFIVPSREG